MTNSKINVISRIVVVGDAYVSAQIMEDVEETAFLGGGSDQPLTWGNRDKEEFTEMQTALESKGPDAVPYPNGLEEAIRWDILIVHFCPVPKKLISCSHRLKAVGICRGGTEKYRSFCSYRKKNTITPYYQKFGGSGRIYSWHHVG